MKQPAMVVKTEETKSKEKYDEYEVKSAVDTLLRAEEIKDNKDLMKLVNVELGKKGKALNKITSLDALREVAAGESSDEVDEGSGEGDEEEIEA